MQEPNANTAATGTVTATSTAGNNPTLLQQQQQQQQLLQQQLFLLHQYQQHHHQQQSQTQQSQQHHQQTNVLSLQQQQAMSRFPSNIDAHLRPMRSLHMIQQPQQQQQQNQPQNTNNSSNNPSAASAAAAAAQMAQQQARAAMGLAPGRQQQPLPPPQQQGGGNPVEVEMAHQDAMKVCNPDVKRPFASVEDAVLRLLPYHVVSDFEAEEDDRILDNDTTGQIPSRLQQWDHNILSKIAEFTTTFEKQVLAFNIMCKKRAHGEFRSEERLMLEQALLQEEKQAIIEMKAEMESREKASREAAEAKMRMAMAQAEQARAQMMARAPMRVNAIGSHGDGGLPEQEMIHGWGNSSKIDNSSSNNNSNNDNNDDGDDGGQRDDEEPSEDFLNDENEPEDDEEAESQEELDLNTR